MVASDTLAASAIAAARRLDLDDLRPQVGKDAGAVRPRPDVGEVDHPQTLQRQAALLASVTAAHSLAARGQG